MTLLNITDCEKNRKELEIGLDKAAFEAETEKAYRKNVSKINIPGFRKGKAPRSIVEKMYGKGVFYEDAIDALLPDAYEAAVKEAGITPVSRPEVDIKSIDDNGVVVVAKVYVKPDVTVKDYKGLTAEKDSVEITDEAVENEINSTRERNARTVEITDRPAQNGDDVVFDFDGYVDGKQFDGGKAEKYTLRLGSGQFIPGFEDQMVGKNIGENFDVNVVFPADYQEKTLAGKPAVFKCLIHEIKFNELPALDDEFVKDVSEFDTVDEYRADVKAKLTERAEKNAGAKVDEQLANALIEKVEGDIPEIMYANEAENEVRDYENRLRAQGLSLADFMKYTGQTEETLKNQFMPQAEKQVKMRLALEYIVKAENITATEDEINEEYQRIADQYGITVENVKSAIDAESVSADVTVGKAMKLVHDCAVITAVGTAKPKKKAPAKKKAAETEATAEATEATETAEAPVEEKPKRKSPAKKKVADADTATEANE
ncbi:MAG: trigger factor [Clostridia bacterium]|nr:trigger factor [Clostridia bacterium]